MGRPLSAGVTAIGGICALVVGLAATDPRVREQLAGLASGRRPSGELVSAAARIEDLALVALHAVRDQSIEHAPLTIFVLAAALLLVFMLRT
jgi:hypothetical protein